MYDIIEASYIAIAKIIKAFKYCPFTANGASTSYSTEFSVNSDTDLTNRAVKQQLEDTDDVKAKAKQTKLLSSFWWWKIIRT